MILFSENRNYHRWLSETEFMLSVVEVAKTPPQVFDRLSAFIAALFPSTTSTLLSTSLLRERF